MVLQACPRACYGTFAWKKGGWALEKKIFGDRTGVDIQISRKTCPQCLKESIQEELR